jgi:GT2 family glycosyltransferase
MTSVSVVILNYNGSELLRQFLPSVIRHSSPAEIIVADNGSTDHSINVLQSEFPQIRIIRLDKNYGFCGGYNRSLQQVTSSYYVLLNSDVEVTPGWLAPLISLFDQHPDVAAAQPKILSYRDKKKFEYAGAAGGFIDILGYPFCRGRIFDHVEDDHGQYDDKREVFWATGACLMVRSEAYHMFGGLDEDMFAHMEEIDLCWKINRSGKKIFYCGTSSVYHLGAGTLEYDNPRKTYLNFRNGLVLIFKHLDPLELPFKIMLRMALDWLAAVVFLLKGRPKNSMSILKAHLHFLKDIGRHREKRRTIRNTYPSYSRLNIHPGLIVFDYYLRSRKRLRSVVPNGATLS